MQECAGGDREPRDKLSAAGDLITNLKLSAEGSPATPVLTLCLAVVKEVWRNEETDDPACVAD